MKKTVCAVCAIGVLTLVGVIKTTASESESEIPEQAVMIKRIPLESLSEIPEQVRVEVKIKMTHIEEGQENVNTLSAPPVTTLSGSEASASLIREFSLSVPGEQDNFNETGKCGIFLTATPYVLDDYIILKGNLTELPKPQKRTLDKAHGEVSLRENLQCNFCVKIIDSNRPLEIGPIPLPGGRIATIMISAYEVTPTGDKIIK